MEEEEEDGPGGPQCADFSEMRGSIGIEAGRMGGIITPDAHRSLYLIEVKRLLSALLGALPSRSPSLP